MQKRGRGAGRGALPSFLWADNLSEAKSAAAERKRVRHNSKAQSLKKHLLGPIPLGPDRSLQVECNRLAAD